ncbi:replication initiator protein [Capybara microvirus Cap1_SP_60]|nr:replication initiator protein [Capybara microvirus Cap1_SP_60]
MCTNPKTIKNPKIDYIKYYDKPYIQVPCGKCKECQELKNNEWLVRNFFECKEAIRCGGYTQAYTTTYRDEDIPHNSFGVKCFSKEDVRKYIDAIKSDLRRTFGAEKINGKFKYYMSFEYGSKDWYFNKKTKKYQQATERPHCHFIFHIQWKCTLGERCVIKRILKKHWVKGDITYTTNTNDGIIDERAIAGGIGAVRYLTNYLNEEKNPIPKEVKEGCQRIEKKIKFEQRYIYLMTAEKPQCESKQEKAILYKVREYNNVVKEKKIKNTEERIKILKREKAKCIPCTMQSSGLGKSALLQDQNGKYIYNTYFNYAMAEKGECFIDDFELTRKKRKLPLYIERKLFYKEVPCKKAKNGMTYKLNEAGKEMKRKRFHFFALALQKKIWNVGHYDYNTMYQYKTNEEKAQYKKMAKDILANLKDFGMIERYVTYKGVEKKDTDIINNYGTLERECQDTWNILYKYEKGKEEENAEQGYKFKEFLEDFAQGATSWGLMEEPIWQDFVKLSEIYTLEKTEEKKKFDRMKRIRQLHKKRMKYYA